MTRRPAIHLTAEMREAAERYAARLMRRHGMSAQDAHDEALRAAKLGLLTPDGFHKREPVKVKARSTVYADSDPTT